MFNYMMSDKSVTYKTEILCSYRLSGRTGRKIIGFGVMIYGPSAARSIDHEHFMFNYMMSDKSVTYKTEILCSYRLSGRTGRKIIGFGVMIYGPSAARSLLHDPEPNIFPTDPTKFGQ